MKITKTLIACDKYFPGDKEVRNIYRVTIANRGQRISFKFGDSIVNTREGKELENDSILSCAKADYFTTKENYPTFENFADDFGYDRDSREAEKIYKNCLKQAGKLHRVFTPEEIEKLPD